MFGSARISTKHLAGLCRRVAISLDAGIDILRVWEREAERAPGYRSRERVEAVRDAIRQGASLREALAAADEFFPPLFREIVEVGDQSGRLAESFAQLADHYEGQLHLRRTFLAALTWPIIELVVTLSVIGVLIWVPGAIARGREAAVDFLGLGLIGNSGLVKYLVFLAIVGALVFLFIQGCRKGLVWTRPIQRILWRLPGVGAPLRLLSLARLTWAMNLTFHTGMDVRRALRLSLHSTQTAHFTDRIEEIERAVAAGETMHEAFRETGAFPPEFLDALHVGEESGKLPDAMGRLSTQYRSRAEAALTASSTIGAFLIWALIAILIIAVIFRVFSAYMGLWRGLLPR
jgi:type II secretory pathway component PulF